MQSLADWLDDVVPEGTLAVFWEDESGTNSDLYTHEEFVHALRYGGFLACTNVRFEVYPEAQEGE